MGILDGISGNPLGNDNLKSIQLIKSMGTGTVPEKSDLIGLLTGGVIGLLIARKWPGFVVKSVGIVVGAELGIQVASMIRSQHEQKSS